MKYNEKQYFRLLRLQDSASVMSAARRKNLKTGSTKNTENKPRKLIIFIIITIIIIIIIIIIINLTHDQRLLRVHLLTL